VSPIISAKSGLSSQAYGQFAASTAAAPDFGVMFPIGMVQVGSGGSSSISFTSIPSTYKHLQIRAISKTNYTGGQFDAIKMRFNSDTGSNYRGHNVYGFGASAAAQSQNVETFSYVAYNAATSSNTNMFAALVLDILDYTSTTKNKTVRYLQGADFNGAGGIVFGSDLWFATPAAINTIDFTPGDGTAFSQYSQFALYGVKGA
jgi:hypothetical protein